MSEYVSLPILIVPLAAAFAAFIVWRFRRNAEMVKPCECGAKRVSYRVIPGIDTNIEELQMHSIGENGVESVTHPNYCRYGGSQVKVLKPRYCAAATKGAVKLPPYRFTSKPPYIALYHDAAACDGSHNAGLQHVGCKGVGRPTSLELPERLAVAS